MSVLCSNDWWTVQSESWSQARSWRFCVGAPSKVQIHNECVAVKYQHMNINFCVSFTLTRHHLFGLPGLV